MAESSGQTIFWNELTPSVKMLFVFSLQAVCLGFDCTYLTFFSHQTYSGGLPLSFAILSFTGAAFLGTVAVIFLQKKINSWLLLLIFAIVRLLLQLPLSCITVYYIPIFLLFWIGISFGIIFSSLITLSLRNVNIPQRNLLISIIYACCASGMFICSTMISKNLHPHESKHSQREPLHFDHTGPVLISMDTHSRYSSLIILIISSAFQASSIYPIYTLWKTQNSDEIYNDIPGENVELSTKLLFLCSVIGFFTNALFHVFPYFLFSYNKGEMLPLYFIVFSASFCIGRIIYTVICRQNEHNIILSLSFVLCGVSVCVYSFEPARLISSALYGFGFSMILPSLTLYIGRQSQNHVNILISGFFFAPVVSPYLLTLTLNTFGPQFFTSINFLTLIVTVFFFVWLLNVQSKMEKPDGEHSAKVWRFFRGEGALKRTKSLRKFIGSIRGSIRGRRYRRMQGVASPLNSASPVPTIQLNSPNRLSPHSYNSRTYRSTQSRIKKPRIEIEDENSSGATVSTPTK